MDDEYKYQPTTQKDLDDEDAYEASREDNKPIVDLFNVPIEFSKMVRQITPDDRTWAAMRLAKDLSKEFGIENEELLTKKIRRFLVDFCAVHRFTDTAREEFKRELESRANFPDEI